MIRDWNRLNPDIRNADTLDAFKHQLNQNFPVIPKHYFSKEMPNMAHNNSYRLLLI